jgi:hypothetical protein
LHDFWSKFHQIWSRLKEFWWFGSKMRSLLKGFWQKSELSCKGCIAIPPGNTGPPEKKCFRGCQNQPKKRWNFGQKWDFLKKWKKKCL